MTEAFRRTYHNDATVYRMFRSGFAKDDIINQLSKEKEALLKRVCELDMIAPRKITVNGETFVYRAPAHLIPE